MKIEKINENKLMIALTKQELVDKNIDIYSFSNLELENYDLFLDIFEQAQSECDFNLSDSPLLIEGSISSNENFILTITKIAKDRKELMPLKANNKVTLKVSRKYPYFKNRCIIYCFDLFDDFVDFSIQLQDEASKYTNILYTYKNKFYLVFTNLSGDEDLLKNITSLLSDFGNYVSYPNTFYYRLKEYGKILIKNNSIKTIKHYFVQNKNS